MTFFFHALLVLAPILERHRVASQQSSFNISDLLDGTKGVAYNGSVPNEQAGMVVSSGGDFNGDGFDDFLVAAPFEAANIGMVYVVFGSNTTPAILPPSVALKDLDGTNGFALTGIKGTESRDAYGLAATLEGDVNGDSINDIIIGVPSAYPNASGPDAGPQDGRTLFFIPPPGQAHVVYGSNTTWEPSFNVSQLNGANGFTINGVAWGDEFGVAVSSGGDFNGDGIDDFAIAALGTRPDDDQVLYEGRRSRIYVLWGSQEAVSSPFNLSDLTGTDGVVFTGIEEFGDFNNMALASSGDLNGDGIDDLVIGDPFAEANGFDRAGQAHVVFGTTSTWASPFNLAELNGINGFTINGTDEDDQFGFSLSTGGDVNGDNVTDIVIGARAEDTPTAGKVYVIFGTNDTWALPFNLSQLNGTTGFILEGISDGDGAGQSVSSAGDVNGDTINDLVIGASGANPYGRNSAGEVYVVYGSRTAWTSPFNLLQLNGTNGYTLKGIKTGDNTGFSVSSGSDLDGDGVNDIVIGAALADPNGTTFGGQAYVVYGVASPLPTQAPTQTTLPTLFPTNPEAPPLACLRPKCCQEECCGDGTKWSTRFGCEKDPSSSGWDGTYPSGYDPKICQMRVCCEGDCCGRDTQYNDDKAECVPID